MSLHPKNFRKLGQRRVAGERSAPDPNLIRLTTRDSVLYGLPDFSALPHIEGLVIRKDWLDKLNLKAPTTMLPTFRFYNENLESLCSVSSR